jgi:hypothetical protein
MVLVKAVMVGAVALAIASAAVQAADPVYTAPNGQTQKAAPANPTLPYSYNRLPGPKVGPSNWIPSTPHYQTSANPSGATGPNFQ